MQSPANGVERQEGSAGGTSAHEAPGVGKRTLVEAADGAGEPGAAHRATAGTGGAGSEPPARTASAPAADRPASHAPVEALFGRSGTAQAAPAGSAPGPTAETPSGTAARYPTLGAALARRSSDAAPDRPSIHDAATAAVDGKGSGSPVDGQVAARVGGHLGVDFGDVRVHSDPLSQEATSAMNARAFAHGKDVFLGPRESGSDLGLMAHELTHVAQQGAAGQRAPQRKVQVGDAGSPAEHEADRVAGDVTAGAPPSQLVIDTGPVAPGQMLKSQFMEELRAQVIAAASEELGPLANGADCPTIQQYFSRYSMLPASAGLALLNHFAPATRTARTAADLIAPMVARVREGVRTWRETGQTPRDLVGLIGESPAGGGGAPAMHGPHAAQALRAPDGRETLASLEAGLGPGAPVDSPVAARLASPLGVDLGAARVHTGAVAAAKAAEVGAPAFAVGNQIVLGADAPPAGTAQHDTLVAHELAHVAQQQAAAGDPVARRRPIGEQDAGAEHAADEAVHDAVRAPVTGGRSAMRTELRVQRGGKPGATSRPGEKWPGGPITALKSVQHGLAEYVGWIRTAESAIGGAEATVQAMRRLYYSKFSGATAGPRFDALIMSGSNNDTPMYAPVVPAETIDRLYETSSIMTPRGEVDVSHLFVALDLHLSGPTVEAQAGELRYGVNLEGAANWLGDLASWFTEWDIERAQAAKDGTPWPASDHLTHLMALATVKVAKDDLLGDFDGQVSAAESTHIQVYPNPGMGGMGGGATVVHFADMPVSQILQQYYEMTPQTGGRGTQSNRFHHFVHNAQPPIPHSVVSNSPLQVALGGDAQANLAGAIAKHAAFFLDHGADSAVGLSSSADADVRDYRPMIDEIARRFTDFLTTGLVSGDAPWP